MPLGLAACSDGEWGARSLPGGRLAGPGGTALAEYVASMSSSHNRSGIKSIAVCVR